MATTLITGISELTTNDDSRVDGSENLSAAERATQTNAAASRITNAAVVLDGDEIVWVGHADQAPDADVRVDYGGRAVLPGWVDSHTHLIFGGDRTAEFEARMAGESYQAGGINTTVRATREARDTQLVDNLTRLVHEARAGGTTTLETKTGYGLTVHDEVRSAKLARTVVDSVTFLGAHIVPDGSNPDDYVTLVTGEMLAAVAPHVDALDVFCERGAFDEAQTRTVLDAGRAAGLSLHVHGNQLEPGPGVQLAVEYGARSVDHVGYLTDEDFSALATSWQQNDRPGTIATVLPGCDLSTRVQLAPARKLLDSGVPVAIASNANPGTSYTTSMAFCVATAVLQMRLSVAEAVRAATLGGAQSLGIDPLSVSQRSVSRLARGVIAPGARADLHVLDAPSATHLAYRPGVPLTWAVWQAGQLAFTKSSTV